MDAIVRGRIDAPRTSFEDTVVEISKDGGASFVRLDPGLSLRVRDHSPAGFSWGYAGSGPSQLSLAILLDLTDPAFALRHYQQFKENVLVMLEARESFEFWVDPHEWAAGVESAVRIKVAT